MDAERLPLPPFTMETAVEKVRLAEDAWNSRDPERVSLAYRPHEAARMNGGNTRPIPVTFLPACGQSQSVDS